MKRVALFVPGGLGGVLSGIHIPTLYRLVERLSERFDIVAYSQRLPDQTSSVAHCGNGAVRFLNVTHRSTAAARTSAFVRAFWADHRQKGFGLLHGMWGIPFGLYAISLGKALNLPSIVSLMGRDTASIPGINYGDLRKQPQRALTRWVWKNATTILAQSEYQVDCMRMFGLRRSDVRIIPHGVETKLFASRNNGRSTKAVHFLSIGDKNSVKDPDTLLKAFAIILRTVEGRLRLIGKDHFHGSLHSLADQLGISEKVEFYDFVPHSEIPQHLSWTDVFLQTSLSEGGGAAVLEAAASGAAICGTNVGLLSDFGRRGMAVAVNPGDHEALARHVVDLLNRPAPMRAMREKALGWVRTHDIEWSVERMREVYEGLIYEDE